MAKQPLSARVYDAYAFLDDCARDAGGQQEKREIEKMRDAAYEAVEVLKEFEQAEGLLSHLSYLVRP